MRKYTVLGSLALFMIIFFQNCGKPPADSASQELAGVTRNQQYSKYSVGNFQTLSMWDFIHARFLDLDMASGKISAFDPGGNPTGQSYQLSAEQSSKLQSILSGAEVCLPVPEDKASEDQMCTMVYRYPYATMIGQGQEVRLGEETNGCDAPVDLCGDKAKQLQAWSKSLVESL
jgi:hypothetical protein